MTIPFRLLRDALTRLAAAPERRRHLPAGAVVTADLWDDAALDQHLRRAAAGERATELLAQLPAPHDRRAAAAVPKDRSTEGPSRARPT